MAKFLIDFDGTCIPRLPENGYVEFDTGAEFVLKELLKCGHSLYLWTARNNSRNNPYNYISGRFRNETSLEEAIRWFKERNIKLSGINEVPGEEDIVGCSRKALADFIIDDTAIGIPMVLYEVDYYSYSQECYKRVNTCFVDWKNVYKILYNKRLIY